MIRPTKLVFLVLVFVGCSEAPNGDCPNDVSDLSKEVCEELGCAHVPVREVDADDCTLGDPPEYVCIVPEAAINNAAPEVRIRDRDGVAFVFMYSSQTGEGWSKCNSTDSELCECPFLHEE